MNVYQNPTQKVKEIPTCKRAAFRGYRAIADLNLRGNKRKSVFSPVFRKNQSPVLATWDIRSKIRG